MSLKYSVPSRRTGVSAFFALISLASTMVAADDLPDLGKTPGKVVASMTKAQICAKKWGKDERFVTAAMKRQVFAQYGYTGYSDSRCVTDAHGKTCEIDHLISRELGGADDVTNLWPQAYGSTPWNAHLKDKLENRLHREMCAGRISLQAARDSLTNDWRVAYRKYYGDLEAGESSVPPTKLRSAAVHIRESWSPRCAVAADHCGVESQNAGRTQRSLGPAKGEK